HAHGGVSCTRWKPGARSRNPQSLARSRDHLAPQIETQRYLQFAFFDQWSTLRAYCRERGIRIMGDLPIYVAHDSADVWTHPQYFRLDEHGEPIAVAGVPPDYFSATGHLWGNPIYA